MSTLQPLNYNKMSPQDRAAIAFEAHTLEDGDTVQLIDASFKRKDSVWCLYADRLNNLNILMLSLTGVYWN